jgi:hypothetical protein
MRYEITTLSGPLLKLATITETALAWMAAAGTVGGH